MRKLLPGLILATVGVALTSWLVLRPGPEPVAAPPRELHDELERSDPPAAPRIEVPARPLATDAPAAPASRPAPPPSVADPRAAQGHLLHEQLRGEGRDPAWAAAAEAQVRERLAARPVAGARDVTVECGASLCRLDATFDSVDARDHGLSAVPGLVPWDCEGFFQAADDDARHMVVYVMREGRTLPQVAAR